MVTLKDLLDKAEFNRGCYEEAMTTAIGLVVQENRALLKALHKIEWLCADESDGNRDECFDIARAAITETKDD